MDNKNEQNLFPPKNNDSNGQIDLNLQNKREKNKKLLPILITIMAIGCVLVASVSVSGYVLNWLKSKPFGIGSSKTDDSSAPPPAPITISETSLEEGSMTAAEVYQKVSSCIVGVVAHPASGNSRGIFPFGSAHFGTGIIVSTDGYVLTNAHVVGNNVASEVTILFEEEEIKGKIVGVDNRTDLAVIKMLNCNHKFVAAQFGNSDKVIVGQQALAIGNPGGTVLEKTLTSGIISAVNRVVSETGVKYIQTDAALNPGNSGGALLNMHGEVIGINTQKAPSQEGIGFAIPSNLAVDILNKLMKNGFVPGRAKLGIEVREISANEAVSYGLPNGLIVNNITNKHLEEQDLRPYDIITGVDGKDIRTIQELHGSLKDKKPGEKMTLHIYRLSFKGKNGTNKKIEVTLIQDT